MGNLKSSAESVKVSPVVDGIAIYHNELWKGQVDLLKSQWCGPRPSVLGQDWSETKKDRSWSCMLWSWSCRSGVVLWNTILSRSST